MIYKFIWCHFTKIDSQNHRKINSSALQGFALILKTAFFKLETISHSVAAKAKAEKISVQDSSMLITPSSPPPLVAFSFSLIFSSTYLLGPAVSLITQTFKNT